MYRRIKSSHNSGNFDNLIRDTSMKANPWRMSFLTLVLLSPNAYAEQYVDGYYRADGTYALPYVRSDSNSTNLDNYSTQGNTNPYSGSDGTRAKDYSLESQSYGNGRTVNTGPRGGQYYLNDNGKKVYVPKR